MQVIYKRESDLIYLKDVIMNGSEIIENQMNNIGGLQTLQCDSSVRNGNNRARHAGQSALDDGSGDPSADGSGDDSGEPLLDFNVWLFEKFFPKSNGVITESSLFAIPLMAVVVVMAIDAYFLFKFGAVILAAHLIFWNHGEGILRRCKVVMQGRVVNNHMSVIKIVTPNVGQICSRNVKK